MTIRSFLLLARVDPGFRAEGVVTFRLSLPSPAYATNEEAVALHRAFLERLESLPEVQSAGLTTHLPLTGVGSLLDPLSVRGRVDASRVPPLAEMRMATPGYFDVVGIPLVRGRLSTWSDVETRSGAVLITARVAEKFFAQADPIGQQVAHGLRGVEGERDWSDVVGVVGDVRGASLFEEPIGAVYYTLLNRPGVNMDWMSRSVVYAIRSSVDAATIIALARRELRELDPQLPVSEIRTLEDVVSEARARTRFSAVLLGIAGRPSLKSGPPGRVQGLRSALPLWNVGAAAAHPCSAWSWHAQVAQP